MELREDLALPSGVLGPRDLAPFSRAASARVFLVLEEAWALMRPVWHGGERASGWLGWEVIKNERDGKCLRDVKEGIMKAMSIIKNSCIVNGSRKWAPITMPASRGKKMA